MRGFLERIRGHEYRALNRGDVRIEKVVLEKTVRIGYSQERVLELTCKSNGVKLCLNDFLPEGWDFRERDEELSVSERFPLQSIYLPLSLPEEHLDGLHFIPSKNSFFIDDKGERMHLFLLMGGAFFGLLHGLHHVVEDEDISTELFEEEWRLRKMHETIPLHQYSEKDRQGYIELVVGSEERAWDGALDMITGFRLQGLDLEPEMSDGELQLFVESCLKSYLM